MSVTRREQLLEVAARLMAERGYHGVSIVELGNAMGFTGPALYRHFPTKRSLLDAMLLDVSERLLAGGHARDHGEPRDALVSLVDGHIDVALGEPHVVRVHERDLPSLSPGANHTVRRLQREYVEIWVRQLMALRPELSFDEARAVVLAAVGLINSTPYSRTGLSPERVRSLVRSLALAALEADVA